MSFLLLLPAAYHSACKANKTAFPTQDLYCKAMSVLQNIDVYHRTMNQWNKLGFNVSTFILL
jgi:hypothetical protein